MSDLLHPLPPARALPRRGLLRGALAGGLAGLALLAPTRSARRAALAQQATPIVGGVAAEGGEEEPFFANEVEVLNYALTLEHLDSTLYRQGLEQFDAQAFVDVGYDASVRDYLAQIVANEETQVAFLTETIAALGGEPVGPAEYAFPYATVGEWLALSLSVEDIGLDAYTGAARFLIGNDDLLTAALTIHAVEARHLAYFRLLNGVVPFPTGVEEPLTPPEVLTLVQPLIAGGLATPAAA